MCYSHFKLYVTLNFTELQDNEVRFILPQLHSHFKHTKTTKLCISSIVIQQETACMASILDISCSICTLGAGGLESSAASHS